MTEKRSNRQPISPDSHAPSVSISPPPRCFARRSDRAQQFCGELAHWERRGNYWFATEYFCDEHRAPADTKISPVHVYRRVRFNIDVLIAGVHVNAPVSHVEALARLDQAVQAIGGVIDVNSVRSDVVKSTPPPPAGVAFARPDDPE